MECELGDGLGFIATSQSKPNEVQRTGKYGEIHARTVHHQAALHICQILNRYLIPTLVAPDPRVCISGPPRLLRSAPLGRDNTEDGDEAEVSFRKCRPAPRTISQYVTQF